MNKTELVAKVAEATGVTKKETEAVVNATIESIMDALAAKDKVQIIGFGTFETREVPERKMVSPRDHSEISVPAHTAVRFKSGKGFTEKVNNR